MWSKGKNNAAGIIQQDRTYEGVHAFNIKQARPTVNKVTRATKQNKKYHYVFCSVCGNLVCYSILVQLVNTYICQILVWGFSPALQMGQVASWLCLLRQKWVPCIDQGLVCGGGGRVGGRGQEGGVGGHSQSSAVSSTGPYAWGMYGGVTDRGRVERRRSISWQGECTRDGGRRGFRLLQRLPDLWLWRGSQVWCYFCVKVFKTDDRGFSCSTILCMKRHCVVLWI